MGAIRGETSEAAPSTECSQRTDTGREYSERTTASEQIGGAPIAAEMGCPFQLLFHTLHSTSRDPETMSTMCSRGRVHTAGGCRRKWLESQWELLVGGHSYSHEGGNGCYPW